jgi:hypothetical protein
MKNHAGREFSILTVVACLKRKIFSRWAGRRDKDSLFRRLMALKNSKILSFAASILITVFMMKTIKKV